MKSIKAWAIIPDKEIDPDLIYHSEEAAGADGMTHGIPVRVMSEKRACLLEEAYEKMCLFYHENTRDGDVNPDTCELRKDMVEQDENFDCGVCEETMCENTQEAKKVMDALKKEYFDR